MAAAPGSRRPLLALVGALVMVAVGLLAYRASQTTEGLVRECRHCAVRGQDLPGGWVNVPADDAWAVQLGRGAGIVVRGPARFEGARDRVALSAGTILSASGQSGRVIVLLPRDLQSDIEGASVGTAAPGTRLVLSASPDGNRVAVLSGQALVSATSGEKKLGPGQVWETGKPSVAAPPDATESQWLDELAGH